MGAGVARPARGGEMVPAGSGTVPPPSASCLKGEGRSGQRLEGGMFFFQSKTCEHLKGLRRGPLGKARTKRGDD